VLYDQTANPTISGYTSQDFTDAGGISDPFDSVAADDFEVPAGQVWSISGIDLPGFFGSGSPGPVDTVAVVFYADAAGSPGAALCSFAGVIPAAQVSGSLSILLPAPCAMPEGRAWMSVQAVAPSMPNGQWFWFEESVQRFAAAVWQNPGDGFATGCTTFMPATSCGASQPDFSFLLRGMVLSDIPTLGGGGLALFALLLAAGSLMLVRRRLAR